MTLFFSTGEASGDAYAAAIGKRVAEAFPAIVLAGVGGRRLRELGANLVSDSSNWGALGILESFRVGPRVLRGYLAARRALSRMQPGVFVPIDFGFINVKLAAHAKRHGWSVLYFTPPGSWRRDKQGGDLASVADVIVTPFPWSAEMLRKMGANAYFFGHPIKQMISDARKQAKQQWARESNRVAVLPGSRAHEWQYNMPAIAGAVAERSWICEFAVASNANPEEMRSIWMRLAPNRRQDLFTENDTYGVLSRSNACIVCSGTATLEAALCQCPCVVVYRGSKLMEIEARIRKPKFDFIALPNILLNRLVVPELIQHDASPNRIALELTQVVDDGEKRRAQLRAFEEIEIELGGANAIDQTLPLILDLAKNHD